ncbi:hypothetical protein LEMLEM_LOCUS25258 [Lemmus lemmus]
MQTNRRWIRSWLPWNLDRIFSLVAMGVRGMTTGATSSLVLSNEQEPAVELMQRREAWGGGSMSVSLRPWDKF